MIVKEGKRSGLAATITFSCSVWPLCPAEVSLSMSPKLPGSLYEINSSVRNAHDWPWSSSTGKIMCSDQ